MSKLVAYLSTTLLILLLAFLLYTHSRYSPRLDSAAVVNEVQRLNQLVTVRYGIEKIVGIKEDREPLGSESILLLVQGKVLAGIELSELRPGDVTVTNTGLRIRLSPPRIQDVFLDEKHTKVWDRSITWWTPWVTPDADLEHKARMQALSDIKASALQMGILEEARRNVETDIRNILLAIGVEKVEFYYGT